MNFIQLREQLFKISGRADLIDPVTYSDLGIGYYINAGQRWLDVKYQNPNSRSRWFENIGVGAYTVLMPACRVIEEVWVYNDESRWQLANKDLDWLRREFSADWRQLTQGKSLYYAPTVGLMYPRPEETKASEAVFNANQANVTVKGDYESDQLIVLPPSAESLTIEVWGLFHSNKLVDDIDISWWSVRYPDVLINATMRAVEISHRNTQGVNDWTMAVMDIMGDIDNDTVAEEIATINQMRG